MAKQRQQFTIEQAIQSVTAAIRIEINPDMDATEKATAIGSLMDTVDTSSIMTMAQIADDGIETHHQVEAVLEAAGVDMVEVQRRQALQGAAALVEAEHARLEAEQAEQIEGE